VLTEEKPVVAKEAVPVERVRLGKEQVTDEVTVSEDVRKEQIDADGVYPEGDAARTEHKTRS
jgi:stress response protein YsnF